MRVVIDTTVWVSRLLLAGSVAAQAVDKALEGFDVMVSDALVEELADVLSRDKFDRYVSVRDQEEFLRRVLQIATAAPVLSEVDDCRDPDDNRLLALALDSESGYAITGDRDLLLLNPTHTNPLPNRLTLLQPPTILCLVMQPATRTYKYRLKVDDRVVLYGITTDLRRREREHRRRWPHAQIEQVGQPTSHREAWEWKQQIKRSALSAG